MLGQLQSALKDRYRVEKEIGAGGMATVYLAHDIRHDRDVAIKVLHPDLAAALGAERFLSEIKTTAKLQHPHILPLLESGDAGGLLYYAMPYVPGETLRLRLGREHQLPVDDAVRLAREVASALDYAHRQGVIHRDIKPENILLHDGSALVADFGIALAVSAASGPRMTQTGLSLGTPQYMSPEQAMGERSIDARADIYALGAVTYEMLAGEAPFTGPTVQAIVARVITEQPRSLTVQRKSVPPAVEHAVMKALEKLPADRYGSAREFSDALVAAAPVAATFAGPAAASGSAPSARRTPMVLLPLAAAIVAGAIGWFAHRPSPTRATPAAFTVPLDPGSSGAYRFSASERILALTPDGSAMAFITFAKMHKQVFLRMMTDLEPHPVTGTEGAFEVAFSPDGEWLAFLDDVGIKKVPARGGTATMIAAAPDAVGLSWPSPDHLLFTREGTPTLWSVPSAGGAPTLLAGGAGSDAKAEFIAWPIGLPDGETVLYASVGADRSFGTAKLTIRSLRTGRHTTLDIQGLVAFGMVGDRLIYSLTDGTLMAVPVDVAGQRATGPPAPLSLNVFSRTSPVAALSANGTFAYIGGAPERHLVLREPSGRIETLTPEMRSFAHPRLSPDGRRIAVEIGASDSSDIWILDRTSSTLSRLTTGGTNQRPEWSVDGKSVLYLALSSGTNGSARLYGIQRTVADGSAPPESVFFNDQTIREVVTVPDGKSLVYRYDNPTTQRRDIWLLPIAPGSKPRPLIATSFDERNPRVSPDGRWIANSSTEGGGAGHEIFVRAFPGPGPRIQISQGGGAEPVWSADGRRIYYRDGTRMRVATVTSGGAFSVLRRDSVFADSYSSDGLHPYYDVGRDGSFVLVEPVGSTDVVVLINWGTLLAERFKTP